jgi:hypothetical protein
MSETHYHACRDDRCPGNIRARVARDRCAVKGCPAEAVWRVEYGGRTVAGQVTAELGSCRPHVDELRNVLTPYAVTEYRERPDSEPARKDAAA